MDFPLYQWNYIGVRVDHSYYYTGEENMIMRNFIIGILWIVAFTAMTVDRVNATEPQLGDFGAWPVLHDGRVKTMESFSRSVFHTIAGTDHLNGIDSTTWMANTLFDPASTISTPFIKINRKTILDLPDRDTRYYSMNEVMTALAPHQDLLMQLENMDPVRLSAPQKELLKIYQAVSLYNQIIQSFSAILPLAGSDKAFIDGSGSRSQRALIAEGGAGNTLLKIIPTDNPSMPMISVWQAVNDNIETPIVNTLKSMAKDWNAGDYDAWNTGAEQVKLVLDDTHVTTSWRLTLEHYYVTTQPILWVMALYVLGVALAYFKPLIASGLIGFGFIVHIGALLSRSLILSRPPTGTLYETLLFGSAIIVLVGLIIYFKNRNHILFLSVCAASAAFLLYVSRGFIQGDSLNVLVAVLNTNFWLSTHVTCIIIGYAFCVMAAMIGHVVLWNDRSPAEKLMVPMTLAALLFTSVGTLLGGIWADQSWGRFWGWDPKENGALLIVLWLIWILHGRISGHFQRRAFAAALALTNIMVALTWFGVNLLGVGLHSYGFIDGIAWGLGSFIVIQITVVSGLYWRSYKLCSKT
jgi:ABC-type transport system involved in cytochrome c biogenesis permease subunit